MKKILFCLIFILFFGVKTPLFAEENYEQYINRVIENIESGNIKSTKENFNMQYKKEIEQLINVQVPLSKKKIDKVLQDVDNEKDVYVKT